MTEAHYHLVVNHFPIIGTILGFGVLLAGILLKNSTVKNVSYVLFIVAAIFAFISIESGEDAAHFIKGMPGIEKELIHTHAETAETLSFILYVLAAISFLGLYTNLKNHSKASLISFLALTIAAVAVFLSQQVGTSGGEIRHTEIRNDFKPSNTGTEKEEPEN